MDTADLDANRPATLPEDRPLQARRRLVVLGVGVGTYLLFRVASWLPGVVEALYARSLGPFVVRPLSHLTGLLPFSLVELIGLSYAVWLLVLGVRAGLAVGRRRRSPRNAVLGGGLRLARDAGVLVGLFYVLWGFNYARRPLSERLEWPAFGEPEVESLRDMAAEAVDAANRAYIEIHGSDDAGQPTAMRDYRELDRALEEGWSRAGELLDLPQSVRKRYGPTKPLLFSPIVARMGIAGFYFPWTAEANLLRDSPVVSRAHGMAHEKAHQRGIGPESEASFLGFLAAALAPHQYARYSAWVFAQSQLLRVLVAVDRDLAREVAATRVPGIGRDLEDLEAYWDQFRGVGADIGRAVNDRYLRANRVHGGIQSYGRSVRLLITFATQNQGRLAPERDGR